MSTGYPLSDELAAVLRAVRLADFAEAGAIAKACNQAVTTPLRKLMLAGLVRSHKSRRADQSATRLYSISADGEAALRAWEAEARRQANIASTGAAVAQPRVTRFTGTYTGAELRPYDGRPGAMDAFALPSRVGRRLRFRNGVVQMLEALPTAAADWLMQAVPPPPMRAGARMVVGVDLTDGTLTFGPVTMLHESPPCMGHSLALGDRPKGHA
ncbi:hypothetical protein [Variovorax atrisoli]|uniref:hypothetical protein n=1 Tax=Variovorax atrisoli TaxID=3394203 RepID=UPI00160ACEC9|nr:hypothetical protein [Variovorax sp. BK613]MBB3642580.1 hypothetical protein [Variovorax sp. BK613]